jgi:nitric oxide reductase NorE protein
LGTREPYYRRMGVTRGPTTQAAAPSTAGPHVPGEIGIWVFILGDMGVFALFFGIFTWERARQLAVFEQSRLDLSITFGAVNTILLLTGSLFVVVGVGAARQGRRRGATIAFALAVGCGLTFGVDKVVEYAGEVARGHTPATNDFFMYYYVFTGLHALHLLVGLGVLGYLIAMARRPTIGAVEMRGIESGASYWHLVDLLWLVLFALLYLMA